MPRLLLALLLIPLLAVAAPVPKRKPEFGPFGDFVDPKTRCTAEMSKDGALAMTVSPTTQAYNPWANAPPKPAIGRTISGDFVLTVRVVHPPEETALVKTDSDDTIAGAGIVLRGEGRVESATAMVVLHTLNDGRWDSGMRLSAHGVREDGRVKWARSGYFRGGRPDEPTHLRLTRYGNLVTTESSVDGKEWTEHKRGVLDELSERVTVGLVAFHSTDQTSIATFDQFSLEAIKYGPRK